MARAVIIATVALAALALVAAQVTPGYPGCKTDADCKTTGDSGAYCRGNGYCHCDSPLYNNSYGGRCQKIVCETNKDCTQGGDASGMCKAGVCSCSRPFFPAPTNAYCNIINCNDQTGICNKDGDSTAYCKGNGACHCGAGFRNYPTNAFCTKIPDN